MVRGRQFRCSLFGKCLGVAGLVLAWGCSAELRTNEPDLVPVAGTITLDGNPIPSAQVQLIEMQGETPRTFLAEAVNGKFKGSASVGDKRVEIRAFREDVQVSETGSPSDVDPQYLPEKYNERTELSVEVGPGGNTGMTFDLKTK